MILCPSCGRPLPEALVETAEEQDDRIRHVPMRELDVDELRDAHDRGYVSGAMFRAESARRMARP